ncbi:unnamed protein product [Camellia sinensis]
MFFGLDYDLDLFNIVAVSDFNIFNSKVLLASPETATDADYDAILGIIGHKVLFSGVYYRTPEHTDEATAKVNDVLARAEEQEQMIESLHTSRVYSMYYQRTADLISLHSAMVENSENYSSSRVSRIDYILYMVFKEVVVWKKKFVYQEKNQEIEKALGEFRKAIKELAFIDLEMKSQCDEKMSDFVFCKTRTSSTKI